MGKRPLKVHTAQEAADGKPRQNKGNCKRNRNNIDLSLYLQKKTANHAVSAPKVSSQAYFKRKRGS